MAEPLRRDSGAGPHLTRWTRQALVAGSLVLVWFAISKVGSTKRVELARPAGNDVDGSHQSEWSADFRIASAKEREAQARAARDATRGAVLAALHRKDWAGALNGAEKLIPKPSQDPDQNEFDAQPDLPDDEERQLLLLHLEFTRELLREIQSAAAGVEGDFTTRLASLQIAVDQQLVRRLDPPRDSEMWGWDSALPDVKWWWDGVPEAQEYINSDERYSQWGWPVGLALGGDGQPLFLEPPPQYVPSLPRSKKLLFVLDEIAQLDKSKQRNAAAAALLARARLMRRLYGPQTDVDWWQVEFTYRFDKRPSFAPGESPAGLKETWELDDDEARTKIGEQSRVIVLPETHSPLALLRRLERDFPDAECVPMAVHERGLYYQSRRQFSKAIAEYEREIKRFPKHRLTKKAWEQIQRIEHADVILGKTGIYASGVSPKLWFACRNADKVHFTARRFDLEHWMASGERGLSGLLYGWISFHRSFGDHDAKQLQALDKFIGPNVTHWTHAVDRSDRVASHSTTAPLTAAGAYLVEARIPGSDQSSLGLVIVSGIAVVQKPLTDRILLWVVDAQSGKPLANQKVRVAEFSNDWKDREPLRDTTLVSDENGAAEFRLGDNPQRHISGLVIASSEERGTTFCELGRPVYDGRHHQSMHVLALTDRPVYRPGSTVNFRIWVRDLLGRRYLPAKAGLNLQVQVHGPQFDIIRSMSLETDELGSVAGSFVLGSEALLGEYSILTQTSENDHGRDTGQFRVEEYKSPEFEVTVTPAKTVSHPGEPISAQVTARYYFGVPVARADVAYTVFREERRQSYSMPAEYDWLYGAGYGVRKSSRQQNDDEGFSADFGWMYSNWRPPEPREQIAAGTAQLDNDGQAEIRFDPSTVKLTGERDWQYTIEVRVRDAGRRTVEATGAVLAPRQDFEVFAELDRGWYAPGEPVVVQINARSASDVPVACTGKATVLRLQENPSGGRPLKELVQEWPISTGADGRQTLELHAPPAGFYRLEFHARDSGNRDVSTGVDFWVYSAAADFHRSPRLPLQIVPDRRTYRIGETARLLVVTAADDALVLMSSDPNAHQFLAVPNYARILELPITESDVPNLFVDGMVVREGRVHTELCELFVPPVRDLLKVALQAEKSVQKPGESGKFEVTVTDGDGRPVSGDLALTAFDKAVTYIQSEAGSGPKDFITARKAQPRSRSDYVATTLNPRRFGTSGAFMCPEFYLTDDYVPQIGGMGGGAPNGGDPGDADQAARGSTDLSGLLAFGGAPIANPKIRSDFSDTAMWRPNIKLDAAGRAETEIKFPESLTTWRLRGFLVTKDTQIGDVVQDVVTSKDLLVRLQRPRFLVERDEVVLSAIVHNNLKSEKHVAAELLVPASLFRAEGAAVPDAEGNLRLTAQADLPSGGHQRFNWTLAVVADGLATITVRALTDEESDALRTALPVRTHGTLVTAARTEAFRADEQGEKTLSFDIPDDADPRKTRITVSLAPTPASAAFEAIPYLAGYPYGCVEQTMSRFYPTVLASRTLQKLGIDVAELVERSRRKHPAGFNGLSAEKLLDAAELERMTEAGLQRLQKFQNRDGGWGWWQDGQSSPGITAYVLIGLHVAAESGANVSDREYDRGLDFLAKFVTRKRPVPLAISRETADECHADLLVAYALALNRPASFSEQETDAGEETDKALAKFLDAQFARRHRLPSYDRLLLALACRDRTPQDRAATVLKEVLQSIEIDHERGTAHVPVVVRDYWHAWNSEIETNAWLLRALVALDRENAVVPMLVNWLALNRKSGRYWRSTQDTALAVTALSEYLVSAGAGATEQIINVRLDQGPTTTVTIGRGDIFGLETAIQLPGDKPLNPGGHELIVERTGSGTLHVALHTEFLRTIVPAEARGNGIAITRRYFRLGSAAGTADAAAGQEPEPAHNKAANGRHVRKLLVMDDTIASGDLVEVELTIKADEDYEYVAFEDMKPAGCEAVQLQSGYAYDRNLWANVELRDDRVVFFAEYLSKGTHVLRYKLRAETPGRFHALPARGFAMYAPEIQAQSDETRLRVGD